MEQHQKSRLTDNPAPSSTASKQQQKRTELLSKGLLWHSRMVTLWETESSALPPAPLHHGFPGEFNTHKFQSYCELASATCGWSPLSPLCDGHGSTSRFARTLSAQEQHSSHACAEDFALWTLISLWYETQTSNTKQGPPNWIRLSEKCER